MMRTEAEIFDLILKTARADERVRAVMLNGSKANPDAQKDIFQDFDIAYLVTELESFKADPTWIDVFGERMVMQRPDDFGEEQPTNRYAYLMQFLDGHRIDLTLKTGSFNADSLSVLLLDKDNAMAALPTPSEDDYLITPPTPKAFFECCNEVWWVAPYVAKGLWRGEITYAQECLEIIRAQLFTMLKWHIGIRSEWTANAGGMGRRFQHWLTSSQWLSLLETYAHASSDAIWESLFAACHLFRATALDVAEHFELTYPQQDDQRVTAHLKHVRQLPRNAKTIY
jgi:aminoglycoside 6-adenylyltransferase